MRPVAYFYVTSYFSFHSTNNIRTQRFTYFRQLRYKFLPSFRNVPLYIVLDRSYQFNGRESCKPSWWEEVLEQPVRAQYPARSPSLAFPDRRLPSLPLSP